MAVGLQAQSAPSDCPAWTVTIATDVENGVWERLGQATPNPADTMIYRSGWLASSGSSPMGSAPLPL